MKLNVSTIMLSWDEVIANYASSSSIRLLIESIEQNNYTAENHAGLIHLISTTDLVSYLRYSINENLSFYQKARKILQFLRNICCCSVDNAPVLLVSIWEEIIKSSLLDQTLYMCHLMATKRKNAMEDESADQVKADSSEADEGFSCINDFDCDQCKTITLLVAQIFSNYSAAGLERAKDIIISSTKPTTYNNGSVKKFSIRDVLAAAVVYKERKATAAVWSAIYNSIFVSISSSRDSHEPNTCRIETLFQSHDLMCQLMLSISCDQNYSERNETDDPVLEWVQLFFLHIVQRNAICSLYSSVASSQPLRPNIEQITCLFVLNHLTLDEGVQHIFSNPNWLLSNDSKEFLVGLCSPQLKFSLSFVLDETKESELVGVPVEDKLEKQIRQDTCKDFSILLLRYISSITSRIPEMEEMEAFRVIIAEEFFPVFGQILFERDPASIKRNSSSKNKDIGTMNDLHLVTNELVKSSLQCIGNIVFRCTIAQNLLVSSGMINSILSHCITSFENPLAREWALLCVRNACEGNRYVQDYIEKLQPQEVDILDDSLSGLKVSLDTRTGKMKVNQS